MRSPSKHVIRPSPGELERKLEEEHARRRRERLSQARSQSYSWGRDVAKNSKSLCEKECTRNFKNLSRDRINQKLMKLEVLESQESAFLSNIGSGRDEALREIELSKEKACLSRQYRAKALLRGSAALEEELNSRKLNDLISKKQSDMKKTALLSEKLRSQRVIKKKNTNFIEYNASKGTLTSKSVPQSEIVSSNKENIVVIRNSFSSSRCNGYDQAQNELYSHPPVIHSKDSLRIKKLQQEAALKVKRAKEEFMNLDESSKSVTQDEDYPVIDTRVIRELPLDTSDDVLDGTSNEDYDIYRELSQIVFDSPIKKEKKKDPKIRKEDTASSSTLTPQESLTDSSFGISSPSLPKKGDRIKEPRKENGSLLPLEVIKINIAETSSSSFESSNDQESASNVHVDSSSGSSTLLTSSDLIANQLREYIDKCLNMKREELDELSSLTNSYFDHSSSVNTTPPTSILSSNSSKKLVKKRPKSVRFSSSTSTTDEEDSRIQTHSKKLSSDSRSHSQLDSISEGFLSISDSCSKEALSPLSSKINSLKDKIFNMEIPVLPKRTSMHPEKLESSSTFISSSIFFSTDNDEKTYRNNSLDNDDNHSSITDSYLSSC